jgi:site-specific recombinase
LELKKTEAASKLAELKRQADEAVSMTEGSPEQVDTYVDVLESLASLYLLQMDRIKMGRSIEEKVKYLIARMTQDIGEAREILKFMFEVQQELGLAKRRPMELTGRFAVLSFDQRQRVGRMLDMVKQKVMEKQHQEEIASKAADEVVKQVVDDQIVEVEPVDQQATQRSGQVIPFIDKTTPMPPDPMADLPFDIEDEEPREE